MTGIYGTKLQRFSSLYNTNHSVFTVHYRVFGFFFKLPFHVQQINIVPNQNHFFIREPIIFTELRTWRCSKTPHKISVSSPAEGTMDFSERKRRVEIIEPVSWALKTGCARRPHGKARQTGGCLLGHSLSKMQASRQTSGNWGSS